MAILSSSLLKVLKVVAVAGLFVDAVRGETAPSPSKCTEVCCPTPVPHLGDLSVLDSGRQVILSNLENEWGSPVDNEIKAYGWSMVTASNDTDALKNGCENFASYGYNKPNPLWNFQCANYTLKSIFCNSAKVSVDSIQAHAHSQVINATTSAFQLNLDLVFGCGMSGCNGTDKMAYGALCDGLNPGMLAKIGIDSDIVLKETCSRAKNTTIPKNAPPKAIPVATALYEARSYLFGTYLGIGLAPYTEYKEHVCRNYGAALKEIIPHYSAQNLSLMHVYNQACNTTNYSVALPIWRAKVFANTIMFSSEDPNLRRAICNNRFPSYNWNVAQWINTGYEFISTEAYLEILEPWCIQLGLADLPDGPRFIVDGLMGDMLKVRGLKSSSPKPSGT